MASVLEHFAMQRAQSAKLKKAAEADHKPLPSTPQSETDGDLDSKSGNTTPIDSPQTSSTSEEMQAGEIERGSKEKGVKKKSLWSFHSSKAKRGSSKETSADDSKKGVSEEIPTEFLCPISQVVMADPVIAASGQTFERQCIQVWMQQGHRHCFQSGIVLVNLSLIPNVALRSAITSWCEKHKQPKPEAPSVELARQSVQRGKARAAMNLGIDAARPGFNDDTGLRIDAARPWYTDDMSSSASTSSGPRSELWIDDGGTASLLAPLSLKQQKWTNSAAESETGSEDDIGRMRKERASRGSSMDLSKSSTSTLLHGALSGEQHDWTDDGGTPSQAGSMEDTKPQWTKGSQDNRGWKAAQGQSGEQRLPATSRDSSLDFDRFSQSSLKEPALQSVCYPEPNSAEWPPPRKCSHGSVEAVREDVEATLAGYGLPSTMATTCPVYVCDEAGQQLIHNAMVKALLANLQHKRAMEQEEGAAEIRRLTRNSIEQRIALCTPEVLAAIILLLQSRYAGVQINAAAALLNLSLEKENKLKISRAGAIPVLIDVLKGRCDAAQEHAAEALFSLALNDENKLAIGVLGAIPPLLYVLHGGTPAARLDAANALYHLSFSHINRGKLMKAGAIPILLQLADKESADLTSSVLLVLSNLATVQEGRALISELNGVVLLVSLLSASPLGDGQGTEGMEEKAGESVNEMDDWASVREHSAATLLQLSQCNTRFKAQALQAGALKSLVPLTEHGTRRARDKAMALLSVLRDSPIMERSDSEDGRSLRPRARYQRVGMCNSVNL